MINKTEISSGRKPGRNLRFINHRKLVVSYNVKKLREDAITAQRKIA